MLKKDLAQALGISGAMVSKLAKRGMPTDTVERAARWRKRHLEPGRVKGQRMGTAPTPVPKAASIAAQSNEVGRVAHLMDVAASILETGGDVAALFPHLRAALRAVPESLRDDVGLHPDIMDALIGPEILNEAAAFQPCEAMQGNPYGGASSGLADSELLHDMGKFWYSVAAGEIKILPPHLGPNAESPEP